MSESKKALMRREELRSKINAAQAKVNDLPAGEAPSDEMKSELRGLYAEIEKADLAYQSALATEAEESKKANVAAGIVESDDERELRSVRDRASLERYTAALLRGVQLTGAEAELNAARGLSASGREWPWDLFLAADVVRDRQRLAERRLNAATDALTPAPSAGNPIRQQDIIGRVFAPGVISRLGVPMPPVDYGEESYPVLSTGVPAAYVAEDSRTDAVAGAITPNVIGPAEMRARVMFRRSDEKKTRGIGAALVNDGMAAMMDRQEKQIIGEGNENLRGFLALESDGGLPGYMRPTALMDFAGAVAEAVRGLDGLYAQSETEIAWAVPPSTARFLHGLFRANADTSALTRIRGMLRDVITTEHIPAGAARAEATAAVDGTPALGATSVPADGAGLAQILIDDPITIDGAAGTYHVTGKTATHLTITPGLSAAPADDAVITRMAGTWDTGIAAKGTGRLNAVAPVWEGIALSLEDDATEANRSYRIVTMIAFGSFKILRADGFLRTRQRIA